MEIRRHCLIALFVAIPLAVTGCGSDGDGNGNGNGGLDGSIPDDDGGTPGDDDGGTDPGDGDTIFDPDAGGIEVPTPDGGTRICYVIPCEGFVYECGDCIDNDGDGLIDDDDPNCLGPCDNNEASFDLQIDGNPLSGCNRDCYYSKDSGFGNTGCDWALECDPETPVRSCCDPNVTDLDDCGHSSNVKTCSSEPEQSEMCLDVCSPLTPNGCDCFGCCDIRTDAEPEQENWVYIGSFDEEQSGTKVGTCDMDAAKAGDHDACRPCTPNVECYQHCGECQLCLGKTADDLPDHCFVDDPEDDAGVPVDERCDDGRQPCGLPGDDPCPEHHFCLTGCCTYAG